MVIVCHGRVVFRRTGCRRTRYNFGSKRTEVSDTNFGDTGCRRSWQSLLLGVYSTFVAKVGPLVPGADVVLLGVLLDPSQSTPPLIPTVSVESPTYYVHTCKEVSKDLYSVMSYTNFVSQIVVCLDPNLEPRR